MERLRAGQPKRQELPEELKNEVKEAFELFDSDRDGFIDYYEFKVVNHLIPYMWCVSPLAFAEIISGRGKLDYPVIVINRFTDDAISFTDTAI